MADTTYYGIPIPTIDADFNTWGAKNNTLHTTWDAKLASPTNTIKGKNTAGTGPHLDLTPAQVVAMLPVLNTTGKGVTPQATAADASRPLVGDGTYKKSIGRAAGAYLGLTVSTVTLVNGFNIASVAYVSGDASFAEGQVTFTAAMANTNYQVALAYESSAVPSNAYGISSKTINGFRFSYGASAHTGLGISVFEAA